eukprot:8733107-Pyramimonas_sp.AAC.1
MAAEFTAFLIPVGGSLARAAFQAGRACAAAAAARRHCQRRAWGQRAVGYPRSWHIRSSKKETRVGAETRVARGNCKQKLDNISTQHDLSLLVRGFRVSSAFTENQAKLIVSLTDKEMQR